MWRQSCLWLCCFLSFCAYGQEDVASLVLNHSFEEYASTPLGWFYTGSDFTRVMKYWESPTAASPDVYGPKVYVPSQWQDKGFGHSQPHGGVSMAGITLMGCEGGKPHCREYLQIQLTEPLVVNQRYEIALWVKPLPRSMRIRNIGVVFSEERMHSPVDERIALDPVVEAGEVLISGEWTCIRNEFYAMEPSEYLVIGNFHSDADTEYEIVDHEGSLSFAYYYVDDVTLVKLPPILEVPVPEDDLSNMSLSEGQTVTLKNIYFAHDRADFLPRSYRELNTLLRILKENPHMTIEVKGHTDNVGTDIYNQELSIARAKAVVNYLRENGISEKRLRYSGYGSTMPVASNTEEDGRQKNRRVEFLILTY